MPSHLDYSRQARTYDRTRTTSPTVTRAILAALAEAPGPEVLDVGGGTGNYALALRESGFRPTVVDVSEAMLERAAEKGLATVRAGAGELPLGTATVDAVTMISMLHLVRDWRGALAEARRVLRPGGVLAAQLFLRENVEAQGVFELFPRSRAWIAPEHQTAAEIEAELPGVALRPYRYTGVEDGSLAGLLQEPELLLDRDRRAQTSYFERLEQSDPEELAAGLARLERRLAEGRPLLADPHLRERWGDGVIAVWRAPGPPDGTGSEQR